MATTLPLGRHPAWAPLLESLAALEVSWPDAFARICNAVALWLDLPTADARRRRLIKALRAAAPEKRVPDPPVGSRHRRPPAHGRGARRGTRGPRSRRRTTGVDT